MWNPEAQKRGNQKKESQYASKMHSIDMLGVKKVS